MKHVIESWRDCRDSRQVEYVAVHNGCTIREAKGSHKVIEAPNGEKMTYYEGEISNGVSCKLFKWFKHIGIVSVFLAAIAYVVICA